MSRGVRPWIAAVACLAGLSATPPPAVPSPAGYHLVWSDEFDGTEVDRTKWDFDTGTGFYVPGEHGRPGQWVAGWGNDEQQCYTDRHANAYVADGALHVRAVHEEYHGGHYSSARLRTGGHGEQPLFTTTYGRVEFRAKLPVGQGYWPAVWLLPQDEAYGGWPQSGEIDVLEARGGDEHVVQGTVHYGRPLPHNVWFGQQYRLPAGGTTADWHVYGLDWSPGRLTWSVDGVDYFTRDYWFTPGQPWPAPFDKPFYLLIDLAVGGTFGGNPTAYTRFPQEMRVDYIRVYAKDGPPGPVPPVGTGRATDPSVVRKPAD